jgi:hypothetical protein
MATKKTTIKKKAVRKKKQQPRKKSSRKKTAKKSAAVAAPEPRQIIATPELTKGDYCNVANIKHTEREFVMDFILGIDNQYTLVSRVLTSPAHMKKLAEVIAGNIASYEKSYGVIDTGDQDEGPVKMH